MNGLQEEIFAFQKYSDIFYLLTGEKGEKIL